MPLLRISTPRTALALACLFAGLAWGATARPARALCVQPQEEGHWTNDDPNTRSLTRAELRFTCQDQILNGQPYPPGPPWHIHLWGKCHPTDCDWGEVGATEVTVGGRTYIYAVYHQGFATRYVYADMSLYRSGELWIWMWTDFTDPARPDYESQNWFVKH
jgi:hypothetical protein